jgi:hypothetical protein
MPRWCVKCRRGFATVIANALGIGRASVYRVIAERLPDVKVGACRFKGIESRANGLAFMLPVRTSTRPTVGQLARAQTFRFLTMLATWALIFAAFIYEPGWIRDSLRFITHSIESFADQVPEPWGARLEIMLRELGGMIWIQIATAIVLLRLIVWVPFHLWRLRRERRIRLSDKSVTQGRGDHELNAFTHRTPPRPP